MGYPDKYYMWEAHGIEIRNPYKSMSNDNIRLVNNCTFEAKI